MKIIKVLTAVIILAFTANLTAQTCNQGVKLAKAEWEEWGPWRPQINLIPFKNKVKKIKRVWNAIASNGSATIGPRYLEFETTKKGNIVGQTKSTFITPPSFEDTIEITINKYDGKAKTGVTICTQTQSGITQNVTSYEFPNNRNGAIKKFTVRNANGKVIIVAMKNKSVGNKFKYRISAKKK